VRRLFLEQPVHRGLLIGQRLAAGGYRPAVPAARNTCS
jgi:hypothetical protein